MKKSSAFLEEQKAKCNWDKDNMFPPPTTDREAMSAITEAVLGDELYFVDSVSHNQCNTEIVCKILDDYDR